MTSGPVPTSVQRRYAIQCCEPSGNTWPGYIALGYYLDSPYDVHATFIGPDDSSANWVMSREQMALALRTAPASIGQGDVVFQADATEFGKFQINVRGFGPAGDLIGWFSIWMRRRHAEQFLALSSIVCPLGEEVVDVDTAIAVLLSGRLP